MKEQINSYSYRKDNRTDEQFANDMKTRTEKQRTLIQFFQKEMEFRGRDILVMDNGIDNNGNVVKGNVGCNADYMVLFDNEVTRFVEVQATNAAYRATFKVKNLTSYIEHNVLVLLFVGTNNDTVVDKNTRWALIDNNRLKEMLEDNKHLIYKEPMFGNKECIKLKENEFHKYFETHRLLHLQ